jgi:hypothetical protein
MTVEMLPNSYLRRYGARYREAWRLAETLRSRRGKDGFPNWPDWCYVPAWYVERHIVAEGRASFPIERAFDPMILSALCAWRMGKGVYRFDPDLLQELWETPVTGEIPGEILLRLPEWCVYLELPGRALGKDMHVQGCFAFVDWEPRFGGRAELCLIADTPEHGLLPAAPIVLGGSIEEGMRAAMGDYMGLGAAIGGPQVSTEDVEKIAPATARAAEPIVSLCLYLCSEEPDIAGMLPKMPDRPTHPVPVRIKGGEKTFAADSPRIWGTGWRLGAAFRKARDERAPGAERKDVSESAGERHGPAPHIRRAHWHTFWTGPRSGPRKPAVKWIPPIPVAFGGSGPETGPAVIRRVPR